MSWLTCTAQNIADMNKLLPETVRIEPLVDANGLLFVGADLLTDSGVGGTYERADQILNTLIIGSPAMPPPAQLPW